MKDLFVLLLLLIPSLCIIPPRAPRSVRNAGIPVTYFGGTPSSEINQAFVGPLRIFDGIRSIDKEEGTITLPLFRGYVADGDNITSEFNFWYIITDASDVFVAEALRVNHSPKLNFINQTMMRTASLRGELENFVLVMDQSALVDFTGERHITPGDQPNFWPLDSEHSQPGSQAEDGYTPLVIVDEQYILNAPIIASDVTEEELNLYCDGVEGDSSIYRAFLHDKIVSICPRRNEVTLRMTTSLSFSRPFWYLALESSDREFAALEGGTWVPILAEIIQSDCWEDVNCPSEIAMAITNGYMDSDLDTSEGNTTQTPVHHPYRQGLNSAAHSEGPALHVMGQIASLGLHYSPFWDFYLLEWDPIAIQENLRTRLRDIYQAFGFSTQGLIFNSENSGELQSSGIIFNAPPVYRLY